MSDARPAPYDALGEAKRLLRQVRGGSLATLTPEGGPHASLVAVATMPDGAPILLLSRLAAHTQHLDKDGRCSLLLAETGKGDLLAHPRLTLLGTAARTDEVTARHRFLTRNPKATLYADFPDFGFWTLTVTAAHLNGGFARAASFGPAGLLTDVAGSRDLLDAEAGAVQHMNADHADAVALYATRLAGLPDAPWRITGLDPEGMDLLGGDLTGRVPFPNPVSTPGALRGMLVALAARARETKA